MDLLYCIAAKARKKWERGKTAWEKQRYSNLYPVSFNTTFIPYFLPGFPTFPEFRAGLPALARVQDSALRAATSSSDSSRQAPRFRPPSESGPNCTRRSMSTVWPTASNMRRT